MSVQNQTQTKLLLIGETGTGKSLLSNIILKKDVFKVGDSGDSETKEVAKCFGEGDRSDLVVIDTPGFNDNDYYRFDTENIQNIVDCVRVEGLQGIILTMNYNVSKFTDNIKQIIEIINYIFKIKDIWRHVCIVWTNCYNLIPQKKIEKGKKEKEQFKEYLISYIKQINGTNEDIDIPMYYVDSDPDEDYDNKRSEEEIERLIEWGRGLKLIDEKEIKKSFSEYKEIRYEEKEEKGKTIKETETDITYEINTYRRCIQIKYNGEEIKGEWYLFSTRTITENKRNIYQPYGCVMV
ncbi:AIG1 family protein [Entamoeba histolytica KU27]|uniref:AIG1 family protein n=1 Tax=Entamoeba histolytica KU27 TaxID=885311 RepID=M2S4P6_ENTHI|nr:AIG1 family protein [Entamoeba histolytica KU27]